MTVEAKSRESATENISLIEGCPPLPGPLVYQTRIPSHDEFVKVLVAQTVERLQAERCTTVDESATMQIVLTEVLRNAAGHGNRGDFGKNVFLRLFVGKDDWAISIEDEGDGFDPVTLIDTPLEDGLWKESGRGIRILSHFMDLVTYFDDGRAVLITRRRSLDRE